MEEINQRFWNASVEELKNGYIYDEISENYICLVCGEMFLEGMIYKEDIGYITAKKKAQMHVEAEHGGMFNYLINLNKKYTGLTDNQKEVLDCFYKGMSNADIGKKVSLTDSTIRSYKFKFREREKQAKVFLTIMDMINSNVPSNNKELIEIHKSATMIDERYNITDAERKKVIGRYFESNGRLINLPSKEKRKIIILVEIAKHFSSNKEYSEKEVNRILERIYDDFVLIRRYLIEYGLMDRNKDGSKYWIKN